MDIKKTSFRMALAALLALPLAALSAPNLSISDTLNAYQLYGKAWISIYGDAETSQGGGVGSDQRVNLTGKNVKINGNLTSGDRITSVGNVDVTGDVNARGDVTFEDGENSVMGATNVGDDLTLTGGNPQGNVFACPIHVKDSPVSMSVGWGPTNSWCGVTIGGFVNGGNRPAGFSFGSNTAFPTTNMRFPDTTVNYDGSRNCTLPALAKFNMSMCGLGGSSSDSILPPGRYGDFLLFNKNTLYLTSGTYHFRSFVVKSDQSRVLFVQSPGATTRLLVHGDFTVEAGDQLIASTRHTDPSYAAGTVFIYSNGTVLLSDDNHVWATVVGKNHVTVESGLRLFGQVFGNTLGIENGFKGGTGFGKYLPMAEGKGPLKYSIIHFKHPQ